MAAATIRVKGYRETVRAFNKIDKGLSKEMREAGKAAGEPVASAAKSKISRYQGASVGTIRPRALVRGVFVTQGAKKVTGLRGDFGVLQMGLLIDALEENRDRVIDIYDERIGKLMEAF